MVNENKNLKKENSALRAKLVGIESRVDGIEERASESMQAIEQIRKTTGEIKP
jgi:predicted  nucleic acid-binding Zn-ribbon protein